MAGAFDSLTIYADEIAAMLEPGESALVAVSATYLAGQVVAGPQTSHVTFDPVNGLDVDAWNRAAERAVSGVTLVGGPGSLAEQVVRSFGQANHLVLTDRRLVLAELSPSTSALRGALPRSAVVGMRVDPRFLQRGRIRLDLAEGSMALLICWMFRATAAHRLVAVF